MSNAKKGDLEVYLPKFKIKTGSLSLTDILKTMGMNTVFESSANFSGYGEDGSPALAPISIVYHSVVVAADEVGIEAAAATAVDGDDSVPEPVFTFDANRPFLFLIRDRPTETVLFAGRMLSPN